MQAEALVLQPASRSLWYLSSHPSTVPLRCIKIMFYCVLIVFWTVEQNVKSQNSKQCVWRLSMHLLIHVLFSFKTLAILCLLTKNNWQKFEPMSLTKPQWMYADMCLTYMTVCLQLFYCFICSMLMFLECSVCII